MQNNDLLDEVASLLMIPEEDLENIYNNLDELGRDDLKARFIWYIIDTVPELSRYKKLTTALVKSILEDGFDDRYNL